MRGALLTPWVQLKSSLTPQPLPLLPGYLNYPDPSYTHKQDYHLLILIPRYKLSNHTWHSLPKEPFNSLILTSGIWCWLHHSFAQNRPDFSLYSKSLSIFTFHPRQGMPWFSLVISVQIRHPFPIQTTNPRQQKCSLIEDLHVSLSNMIPSPINFLGTSSQVIMSLYMWQLFLCNPHCPIFLTWSILCTLSRVTWCSFLCDFPFESQATKGQYQLGITYY